MTDMLEKIARAMVEAEKDEWDLPAEKWSVQALEDHGLMGLARAALLAMREPTEKLVDDAGRPAYKEAAWDRGDGEGIAAAFTAMIDAILKEGGDV